MDRQRQTRDGSRKDEPNKGGLNIEIHPLLRDIAPTPRIPKNHNPLKRSVRNAFDPTAINPYLNQADSAIRTKKHRSFELVPQGKYIAEADALRTHQKIEAEEQRHQQEIRQKGLLPDTVIGEDKYRIENPPPVEWWDRPYLKENTYDCRLVETKLDYENDKAPITEFIQHPVFLNSGDSENNARTQSVYLTKKEMKKMRRNERLQRLKDKQDRIKLGIDPPPPPKVRLSNLMNVLANESARDPTALEMKVRQEAKARVQQHMRQNKERQLTKEEKSTKIQLQHERDLLRGRYVVVFRIESLANGKHLYKININAKQLDLHGVCLHNPKFNLVIIEGGNKGIKFYKKLLLNRIKWTEPLETAEDGSLGESQSDNQCRVVWENEVKELTFKKWSQMYTNDDDHALDVLRHFGVESYWREALTLDEE